MQNVCLVTLGAIVGLSSLLLGLIMPNDIKVFIPFLVIYGFWIGILIDKIKVPGDLLFGLCEMVIMPWMVVFALMNIGILELNCNLFKHSSKIVDRYDVIVVESGDKENGIE